MAVKKKTIIAWSMYDLANTAFSALFVTFAFPLLIKVYLGGNEFQIGLMMGISMFIAGLMVPMIGAMSDELGRRIPFIVILTVVCVIATSMTGFMGLYAALALGLVANFCYNAALDVYDAILPSISTKKNIGLVSGCGVALGYFGTIFSLVMATYIYFKFGWGTKLSTQVMFPAIAAFFLFFSSFTFLFVKEKVKQKAKGLWMTLKKSYEDIKFTVKSLPGKKSLMYFLIASFFYTDGIHTSILFLFLFGREKIGLTVQTFFIVYAAMALAASLGAILAGYFSDRVNIGPKKSLSATLLLWVVVISALMRVDTVFGFFLAGSFGGIALGAVTTLNRPMIVALSPKKKIAQLFGFLGMMKKFSAVAGPILFGFLVTRYNYSIALISLLVFFGFGFIVLQKVRIPSTTGTG